MVKILFENNFKAKSYFNLSLYQKLALIFLILITLVAFLAPFFAPYDPSFFHLQNLNERPSLKFILGTDPLGRDLFSAILYGTRSSILIGFLSALIISVIGIFVGSLAALSAPWVDNFIMRTLEVINSIPAILVVLLLGTLIRSDGILEISILVGMSSWFSLARIVRVEAKQISKQGYIEASYAMGGNFLHILIKHILPNILSPILFVLISSISFAMGTEATLSFLGLGLPPDELSLGSLLGLSKRALLQNSWPVIIFPSIILVSLLLSVTIVGSTFGSHKILKPRML